MTVSFEPTVITDVEYVQLILDYVMYEDTSMQSLADEYEISKSCVWKYLKSAHVYDNKLDDLIHIKARSRYWGVNLPVDERGKPFNSPPYKLKQSLFNHLQSKYYELSAMTSLPPDLGKFLWGDYKKTSK